MNPIHERFARLLTAASQHWAHPRADPTASDPTAAEAPEPAPQHSIADLSLRDGLDLTGMTDQELWLRYISVGGCEDAAQLKDEVLGRTLMGSYEHNMIAQAINEFFLERGGDHPVGYRESQRVE